MINRHKTTEDLAASVCIYSKENRFFDGFRVRSIVDLKIICQSKQTLAENASMVLNLDFEHRTILGIETSIF